jgi:hypothetical protein
MVVTISNVPEPTSLLLVAISAMAISLARPRCKCNPLWR